MNIPAGIRSCVIPSGVEIRILPGVAVGVGRGVDVGRGTAVSVAVDGGIRVFDAAKAAAGVVVGAGWHAERNIRRKGSIFLIIMIL